MIRKLIQNALGKLGYVVSRDLYRPAYLSSICQPKTVIDVGVGTGTYPLYEAFPTARFILVEPLREYQSAIEKISQRFKCSVHYKAVGAHDGSMEMNVDPEHLLKSSLVDRTALTKTGSALEKRTVEIITLDTIFKTDPAIEKPILLKLDTEGYELAALEGAKRLLQSTDTVIIETSIARRFENSYEFEDVAAFMNDNGFYLFSFLTLTHVAGEPRPRFADVVYKRRDAEKKSL